MRRHWRAFAALALAWPFIVYAALRLGLLTPLLNLTLASQLGSRTPVQVRVGAFRSDIMSFVEVDDVVVLAPVAGGKLPLMTVSNLRLEYRGWSAWQGRLEWSEALGVARIRGLSVFLLRGPGGAWNISALGGKPAGAKTAHAQPAGLGFIPAGRVELEGSQLVLNDEVRGFRTSIEGLQGSLDTRSLPLLAFSLNGRTEGKGREDLSLAGELDQRDGAFFGRLDLHSVPLARYLNYFLPGKGLSFESGDATLSVRLRKPAGGELGASGRAELVDGSVRIPGIAEPLTGLQGAVAFDPDSFRFRGVRARFLDSDWTASGSILDLRAPSFDVQLSNPALSLQALSSQVSGMSALALSGSASVSATLSGPAARPLVQAQVQAESMALAGLEMGGVSATARLQGSQLELSSLRGSVWGGRIEGDAAFGLQRGGAIRAQLSIADADLDLARIHGQRPLPVAGVADLKATAEGRLRDPTLSLVLGVRNATLGRLKLGTLSAEARWSGDGLESRFSDDQGRLSGRVNLGRGQGAAFKDTAIDLRLIDVVSLAQGLASAPASMALPASATRSGSWLDGRLGGVLQGRLSIEGPVKTPTVWLSVDLRDGRYFGSQGLFTLRKPAQGLALRLEGDLGFRQGEILLGRSGIPLKAGLSHEGHALLAQALGRYPLKAHAPSGKLDLALDGDLGLLDAFVDFESSGGRLNADFSLAGSPDAPEATGDLKVSGFNSKLARYLAPVKGGELHAQMRGQRIDVPLFRLRAGGQVSAKGDLDLSGGLLGLRGTLEVVTDDEGLRLQNWDAMGSGSLVLKPLIISVDGEGQPLRLRGQARISNALVVYAGRAKAGAAPAAPQPASRPLEVDLRVALGPNVWYEKRATGGVEIFDPSRWISGTLESVQETFQRPDVFFRLRPTDEDIVLRTQDGSVRLSGSLVIDRGRLTLMENDFEIKPERKPALIRFNGRQAEVSAEAVGRLRYTRDNEVTKRPQQRIVDVVIVVEPLRPEELERSDLANAFLNYSLSFQTERPIEEGKIPAHQQKEAILNLVVLGDPLIDLQQQVEQGGGQDSVSKLTEAQLNRLISGEAKRQLAAWSKRGFKFLGTQLVDVLRVVPRFSYQSGASGGAGATTVSQANQQAQEAQLVFNDLTIEIGKSLGEQLYGSVQWVRFGENSVATATATNPNANQVVRDSGLRAGMEYQISANRTVEAFYNYSLDDNMQPKPFDPRELWQAHGGVVRLRNTIPTENYTPKLARERRWDQQPRAAR